MTLATIYRMIYCAAALAITTQTYAQQSGSLESYRARVRAQQQATNQQIRQDEYKRKLAAATQLKHPTFNGPAPVAQYESDLLNITKLEDGQNGFIENTLLEVLDIVGPNEVFLLRPSGEGVPVCVVGASTTGLVDEQAVRVCGPIRVDGTKTYENTSGGMVTIRVIRMIDASEWDLIDKSLKAEIAAERLAAEDALYRTWTSADGKHKTEAKFLKFEKGKVHLQNRAGKVIELSPNQLSAEDRRLYRELAKQAKAEANKEPWERAMEQLKRVP